MPRQRVRLALAGDVMLGRGVDQILSHPGDPALRERYVTDARRYVRLAEAASGRIPAPVDAGWPWGDALPVLDAAAPDVRLVNLECAVTTGTDPDPDKGIHYRLHPANLACLAAGRPDVCVLANNHVLDYGRRGLADTLTALDRAGLRTVGAGGDAGAAWRPAAIATGGIRVLVFAFGVASCGISASWAAGPDRSGVAYVPDLSVGQAAAVADRIRRSRGPADVVVVSVHWGPNWGHPVGRDEARFAHALVDAGVDVVHGHSAHHARPVEVYRDRLILYGSGDLINDYEGIAGHVEYRPDLRLLHLADVAPDGRLLALRMVPLRCARMRLDRASRADAGWLAATLDRRSRGVGLRVATDPSGRPTVRAERR